MVRNPQLLEATHVDGYRIRLVFDDGSTGIIDLTDELDGEVFEPLRDLARFQRFRVDPDLRTLVWPNGADFAPEFLFERITT